MLDELLRPDVLRDLSPVLLQSLEEEEEEEEEETLLPWQSQATWLE